MSKYTQGDLTMKKNTEKEIVYLLPLKWSLHYTMSSRDWKVFRRKVQTVNSDWDKCSCPKRCTANNLDEIWKYDHINHTKIFVRVEFICPGCHWLKSVPWRTETWLQIETGEISAPKHTPHIIGCLGWSPERVEKERQRDLKRYHKEMAE